MEQYFSIAIEYSQKNKTIVISVRAEMALLGVTSVLIQFVLI